MRCSSLVRVVLPDDEGPEIPIIEAISLPFFPSLCPCGVEMKNGAGGGQAGGVEREEGHHVLIAIVIRYRYRYR